MEYSNNDTSGNIFLRICFQRLLKENVLLFSTFIICFSYFYNLPILKYALKGDNEFRIYDIFGLVLIYFHFKHKLIIHYIFKKNRVFKWFSFLLIWSSITLIFTFFSCIYYDNYLFFFQTILYFYHFYVFFSCGLFVYILCYKKNRINFYVNFILFFSCISFLIVILQNFNIIPFLWNDVYKEAYRSFLSGTLGPNKIVLGMTSFFIFVFSIGVLIEKNIKKKYLLVIITLILSLYVLLLSGSRTSYMALIVFIVYFSFFKTSQFVFIIVLFLSLFSLIIIVNNDIYEKIDVVINNRVVNKVKNKDDLTNANVENLYEDLGAGRKGLTEKNGIYLIENPLVIPFGLGFNNRIIKVAGASAHNMYIQVIKELGIVGFVLYFGWLIQYLLIDFKKYRGFSTVLKGLVLSMLITLFFGEHLYIYRPLFGLLGLFILITSLMMSILHIDEEKFR